MAKKSKNKTQSDNQASFHGGLTFKQFRRIGHVPLEMNDIAWAGRIFPMAPYWFKRLSLLTFIFLLISALSLGATLTSVLLRKPALLLGVYPDGEIICFPRLRTSTGALSTLHPSYEPLCNSLDVRAGKKWQLDNAQKNESGTSQVGNIDKKVVYKAIDEITGLLPISKPQPVQEKAELPQLPAFYQNQVTDYAPSAQSENALPQAPSVSYPQQQPPVAQPPVQPPAQPVQGP